MISTATITAITTLVVALGALVAGITAAIKAIHADANVRTVSTQVQSVDQKVDGHLSLLTQAVVNSAVNATPIDRETVQALVDRSNQLTGQALTVPGALPGTAPVAAPIIVMPPAPVPLPVVVVPKDGKKGVDW